MGASKAALRDPVHSKQRALLNSAIPIASVVADRRVGATQMLGGARHADRQEAVVHGVANLYITGGWRRQQARHVVRFQRRRQIAHGRPGCYHQHGIFTAARLLTSKPRVTAASSVTPALMRASCSDCRNAARDVSSLPTPSAR